MSDLIVGLVTLVVGPILVIWWIPLQVHELGHVLGARLVGARFAYVPLGPFVWARGGSTYKLHLRLRRYPCDATFPRSARPKLDLFISSLSGPLLGIAVGVVVASAGFSDDAFRFAYMAPLVLIVVGGYVGLTGLVLLLPWRPYGVPSDGARLLSLIRRTPQAGRWVALKALARLSDEGTRPRDWPTPLLSRLLASSDGSTDDIAGALTLYEHLLDDHRIADARALLEQARAAASNPAMSQVVSQLVRIELAYMEARAGDDPSEAVDHFMRSAFIQRTTLLRVSAAIQLRYSYFAQAIATAEHAIRGLAGEDSGYAQMERDLLSEVIADATTALGGGARGPVVAVPVHGRLDVSRFAIPDVPLRPEPARPSVRSARTLVGAVASATLALTVYAFSIAIMSRSAALVIGVTAGIAALLIVIRVRRVGRITGLGVLRQLLVGSAIFCAALPFFLSDLLTPNSSGYIWFTGLPRPCLVFGPGHDVYSVLFLPWGAAFALVGLLIAIRVHSEPVQAKWGIAGGIGAVVLWLATLASDHARFAAMIGCN